MSNSRFTLNQKLQIFSISEDCLILNIYSPAETTAGAKLPVYSPEAPIQRYRATCPSIPPFPKHPRSP